jgi:polyhydroxyalkanoate synthesis repressor PhaR
MRVRIVGEGNGKLDAAAETGEGAAADRVIIKKYANRRLYNTSSSSYVTLEHLSEMVRAGVDFVVLDAKSDEDITRSVLAQIIFEQESRGQNLLPVQFLRRLIRIYGDQMQGFLPPYLEMSMESFSKAQEQMRDNFTRTFGAATPVTAFEDLTQRNMAMFQQAMKMWTPFGASMPGMPGMNAPSAQTEAADAEKDEQLAELKRQMAAMQKQLEALSRAKT